MLFHHEEKNAVLSNFGVEASKGLDPKQIKEIRSVIKELGTYTVNYGDLDQNCHMNNTRYPDMYSNFLPLDGMRIKSISINYKNEARRGERLRVERADGADGKTYYFRTVRTDGLVNSEAEI